MSWFIYYNPDLRTLYIQWLGLIQIFHHKSKYSLFHQIYELNFSASYFYWINTSVKVNPDKTCFLLASEKPFFQLLLLRNLCAAFLGSNVSFSCSSLGYIRAAASNSSISPSSIFGLGVLVLEDSEENIVIMQPRQHSLNSSFHIYCWFSYCSYCYSSCSECWRTNCRSTWFRIISQEVLNLCIRLWGPWDIYIGSSGTSCTSAASTSYLWRTALPAGASPALRSSCSSVASTTDL